MIQVLTEYIREWAIERKLDCADPNKQMLKLGEEFGELCQGMAKSKPEQVKDSIGDMYVVMTILSMQLGLEIEDCIQQAYDEIKDRKGKMLNGVYVKVDDLPSCPHGHEPDYCPDCKKTNLNLCPHGDEWDDCPDCRH